MEATAIGKPVFGFETATEQLRILASDALELQFVDLRVLANLIENIDFWLMLGAVYDLLWNVWREGDLERIAYLLLADEDMLMEELGDDFLAGLTLADVDYAVLDEELNALYPAGDRARPSPRRP